MSDILCQLIILMSNISGIIKVGLVVICLMISQLAIENCHRNS